MLTRYCLAFCLLPRPFFTSPALLSCLGDSVGKTRALAMARWLIGRVALVVLLSLLFHLILYQRCAQACLLHALLCANIRD